MIRITKLAKLPIEYSKGTDSARNNLAKKLNAEFFEKISKKFKSDEISFNTFQRTLKETIPTKSSVKLLKADNSKGAYGYIAFNSKNNVNVNGYLIFLPKKNNGKISLRSVNTFMHETYHYFRQITTPKEPRRTLKLLETGNLDSFENVYNTLLYNDLNIDKNTLNEILDKTLAKLNIEQKIDFLQFCRYGLRQELHAYSEGEKYHHLAQQKFNKNIPIDSSSNDYNFEMKINLLTEKLRKVMKDYRESK